MTADEARALARRVREKEGSALEEAESRLDEAVASLVALTTCSVVLFEHWPEEWTSSLPMSAPNVLTDTEAKGLLL